MTTYDIGRRRPDGKYNVWARLVVRAFEPVRVYTKRGPAEGEIQQRAAEPDWVVVYVADNGVKARAWVNEQEARA